MPEQELEIELDDLTHKYTLGGIEIPGCTAVLQKMGATPSFGFLKPEELKWYQDRGHAVHKAVELFLRDSLDRRTLAKEIRGYLASWERGVKDYQVEVIRDIHGEPLVEKILLHPAFRYGVRPDIFALVRGKPSVIEIKATSQHNAATGLQTAAQRLAARSIELEVSERYAFRLDRDGGAPSVKRYQDPSDEGVWLSMLNSYNWKAKHKLI